MMKQCDVVVVGGGPAGSTAARYLAAQGARVCLIEKNTHYRKSCGGGIPSSAFDELALNSNAVVRKIQSIVLVSPSGERIQFTLKGGALYIVERQRFDRELRNQACEEGSEFIEGTFLSFKAMDRQIVLQIREKSGRDLEIRSDYVIGCDGVNSRVRRALGIPPVKAVYTYSEIIRDVEIDECEFWFGSRHADRYYSWIFPRAEGCTIGTGAMAPEEAKNYLDRFAHERGVSISGKGKGYWIPIWERQVYNKKRIFLAGDAASHVMPLTYEGIYYAMKSAQLASSAILDGKVSHYRKFWLKRFGARFRFMKGIERYVLKKDKNANRLVRLFQNPALQAASMKLWLEKDGSTNSLLSFTKIFGKYFH